MDIVQHMERFGRAPLPAIADGEVPAGDAHGERDHGGACYCGWLDYFSCPDWLAQFCDDPAVEFREDRRCDGCVHHSTMHCGVDELYCHRLFIYTGVDFYCAAWQARP